MSEPQPEQYGSNWDETDKSDPRYPIYIALMAGKIGPPIR